MIHRIEVAVRRVSEREPKHERAPGILTSVMGFGISQKKYPECSYGRLRRPLHVSSSLRDCAQEYTTGTLDSTSSKAESLKVVDSYLGGRREAS